MNRRNTRISIVRGVYSTDFNTNHKELFPLMEDLNLNDENISYMENIIEEIKLKKDEIDAIIVKCLKNWTLVRLPKVDLAILRVAVYEMKYCDDIPVGASINEAVEIAKIYSTIKSSKYINGVLSGINKSLEDE